MWQLRAQAREAGTGLLAELRRTSDPSLKTVAAEDSAALIGVTFAATGMALHEVTGSTWWEGCAAAAIAVLLVVVAITLGRDTKALLIGEAVEPEMAEEIRSFLLSCEQVDDVIDLLTMRLGVHSILLAARVDLAANLDSDGVEAKSRELDEQIQRQWPDVTHVFIDPTHVRERVQRVGLTPSKGSPLD